ncbi:aldehyde dehydrogenase family protein [Nesterenkonia haasae]|uniref:aldehyde dehydrogenase family protein n=1 Tax=Nesterenkonia haasae TaxID=2587813 RepID=UPI0038B3CACD|nr:aldehyde dehydrogenase family protein [Nesterenkonia haasae]
MVTGRNEVVTELITNDDIAKLTLTGSVGGWMKLHELASQWMNRVTLELGGNDPALILEDPTLYDLHLDRLYVQRARVNEVVSGLSTQLDRRGGIHWITFKVPPRSVSAFYSSRGRRSVQSCPFRPDEKS